MQVKVLFADIKGLASFPAGFPSSGRYGRKILMASPLPPLRRMATGVRRTAPRPSTAQHRFRQSDICIKSSHYVNICQGNDTLFYVAISRIDALIKLARRKHVLRARDMDEIGIPRNYLLRLVHRGTLERIGRGLYAVPNADITEHQSLLEVALRVPNGVICLLSALRFHGLTTQAPFEVWIAIDRKAWKPRISSPPVRVVRFSGSAFTFGVSVRKIGGAQLRIFDPAKTVADCFKYRHKIGLDVALEALRDCYRQKKATIDQIWEAAKVCRVSNVVRPYMETLT
jgi:predicted transcriptional regulator of viral defense system